MGFVAHSYTVDPKHVNTGSYWLVPLSYHTPLDQDVVVLKKAENSKTAQAFIDYVRSLEGKKIIEASGYTVP
jgi:molybdate transport system substrate-binding protein